MRVYYTLLGQKKELIETLWNVNKIVCQQYSDYL